MNQSDWLCKIFEWANDNNIEDMRWVEPRTPLEDGKWVGLPRNEEKLLSITELDISSYDALKTPIPLEIGNLENLTELSISLKCDEIPSTIGELKNLRALTIFCDIKTIPLEICQLSNLETLYISSDNLNSLPNEIGGLSSLIELNIERCANIRELPESIVLLKVLKTFTCSCHDVSLTLEQSEWIKLLLENQCEILFSDELLRRSETKHQYGAILNILLFPYYIAAAIFGSFVMVFHLLKQTKK